MLIEVIQAELYSNARQVVDELPGGAFKVRMHKALQKLRLPYWDAAAVPPNREGSLPWCVQRKTIKIELPFGNGTANSTIPNPLYAYNFHPLPLDAFSEKKVGSTTPDRWTQWNSTMRCPTTLNASGESRDELIALHLDANRDSLRQRTYQMLALQTDYYNISNNMVRNGVADSLESIHDTLHNTIGDGGHMWNTQYSAFDPIFWLLHA
jgi:tyrosinase